MSKLPLVQGIAKYLDEKNIYMCMPGHKNGKGFSHTFEGRRLFDNFIKGDITEVEGVDNLHNPTGIINEAQKLLSEAYGSDKSYFLVNGSTSGNMAMIFSSFNEGDEIIVERNCHRSIYNAIIMRKLRPIYIENNICEDLDTPLCVNEDQLIKLIRNNSKAKGVILTYPNYYGVCIDLERVISEAHLNNMKVLIDSAHGAHFGFNEKLPKSAVKIGADMVVMSAHKTLPSLTQTAFLHINDRMNEKKVEFYISAFLSTSPSYMLMQSMDYARFYLQQYGDEEYDKLIKICEKYKNKINAIEGFNILDKKDIKYKAFNRDIDKTRYVINLDKGLSGHKLNNYLRKNKIQAEMSDSRSVILIFSPFNTCEEFERLFNVLKECDLNELKGDMVEIKKIKLPKLKLLPFEAFEREKEKVSIIDSLDKVCGEAVVPYPPGVPLIMPGEIIDENTIRYINYCLLNKMDVLGITKEEITVVKQKGD